MSQNLTITGRGTPATTPEDEDTSLENDGNGHHVPASKPRTKIKPKVEEATTTEKEHVNVVFIGHVGECELFASIVWRDFSMGGSFKKLFHSSINTEIFVRCMFQMQENQP